MRRAWGVTAGMGTVSPVGNTAQAEGSRQSRLVHGVVTKISDGVSDQQLVGFFHY